VIIEVFAGWPMLELVIQLGHHRSIKGLVEEDPGVDKIGVGWPAFEGLFERVGPTMEPEPVLSGMNGGRRGAVQNVALKQLGSGGTVGKCTRKGVAPDAEVVGNRTVDHCEAGAGKGSGV